MQNELDSRPIKDTSWTVCKISVGSEDRRKYCINVKCLALMIVLWIHRKVSFSIISATYFQINGLVKNRTTYVSKV